MQYMGNVARAIHQRPQPPRASLPSSSLQTPFGSVARLPLLVEVLGFASSPRGGFAFSSVTREYEGGAQVSQFAIRLKLVCHAAICMAEAQGLLEFAGLSSVMKVIVARDIVKYHGGDLKILSGATLSVEVGEKIGLVGRNGVGKTTLLNVLSGNLEPDGGAVERVGGVKVGMTSQSLYVGTGRSVEEEMLSAFEGLIRREEDLKALE